MSRNAPALLRSSLLRVCVCISSVSFFCFCVLCLISLYDMKFCASVVKRTRKDAGGNVAATSVVCKCKCVNV